MNMKKIISSIAAIAMTASLMTVADNAADWSKASYADDDPTTVEIVSTSADGVTFTQQVAGGSCKARITLVDVLANAEDVSKIKSGSWKLTYTGLSNLNGTEIGWLGGGCYVATGNSAGFNLAPNEWAEDGTVIWEDTQTVEDSFKYLLPTSVPTDAANAEFVFMDWSGQDLVANGITLTISDFHLYDEDGNEIAQKAYAADEAEAPAEDTTAAAEEETAEEVDDVAADVEDDADEVTAEVEDEAEEVSVDDTAVDEAAVDTAETTTAAATGNAAAASIVAVMAVAGAAAVATKKRK